MSGTDFDTVILAAGASTRLGQPKQLLTLWGRTLIERAVLLARAAGAAQIHVVLGASSDDCRAALSGHSVSLLMHHTWRDGQASSLACGLRAAARAAGVLVLVCDQYRLRPRDLATLIEPWRREPQRTLASHYGKTTGVPVLWPSALARQVAASGAAGRDWLANTAVEAVAVPNAAFDLDRPADIELLRHFEAVHDDFL